MLFSLRVVNRLWCDVCWLLLVGVRCLLFVVCRVSCVVCVVCSVSLVFFRSFFVVV